MRRPSPSRFAPRVFCAYAALTAVPVLLLGAALATAYRSEARRRGIAEGRSQAALIAHTAIEPVLGKEDLSTGITPNERADLDRLIASSPKGTILRLRVRDLAGHVVFSADGSGLNDKPEDEAERAAHGETITRLTHLNTDINDSGPRGVAAVEAYRPLVTTSGRRFGVLEVYLPYAPIQADVNAGLGNLYRDLAGGLVGLYLALFALAWSVSRGLRRQVALNAFLAEHDALTELPNRTLFHRRVGAAVGDARPDSPAVVAIIDLDRFKDVNDTLGHNNGDHLLVELASRLSGRMAPGDTVARLGGDEFGVILRAASDPEGALVRLRHDINEEIEVSGLPISVEASIGFVVAPADGSDADDLLQRADVAMYVAKAEHIGVARYDPSRDHYDAANLGLVSQLRHAIDDGELVLHYQPKTTLTDGRVEAVEALVRWQHPEHGLLAPDRFLPLAEQTDLIDNLTDWVLIRAISDLRALGQTGEGLSVAVNVSARSLNRIDFARRVTTMLKAGGLPTSRLIIEITETALLIDPDRAAAILSELSTAGVRVSVDDFGCGQTSLGYLSALTVHELKIDKSFVTDMVANPAHAAIVRSVVDLGHNLALRVVGEGVETGEVLAALRASGCDVAQGYLLARPMPMDRLTRWLVTEGTTSAHNDGAGPDRFTAPDVTALVP